jgi:hypothetical protein
MENNDYNKPFSVENVEEPAHVEAPVVETPAEPVAEPVVEPVVDAPVEVAVESAVVEAPPAEEPVQSLGFTETGAIGSMAADGPKKDIKPAKDLGDKVAIYSTSNVRWEEANGAVYKGVNIVTKDQADKWLTRAHVRLATTEEVQKAVR